jgi:hypothetical protein
LNFLDWRVVTSDVVRTTVDKILWMGVLCIVTWCAPQSIEYCGWACCV